MVFLDAAYKVLKEQRQWMHVRELVQQVIDRGLYTSDAADPMASLVGTLYTEISRRPNTRGFVRRGPRFGLKEWGAEVPPYDTSAPPKPVSPGPVLTEAQILAIKKTMPPDQFDELFGDVWQRYQEQQRRRLVTQIDMQSLMTIVRREVSCIQDYLLERSKQAPQPQAIVNWIVFCYQLELYREGVALFKQIGPDQVGEALYGHLYKIAQACELHVKG